MENFKQKFDQVLIDTLSISQEQINPQAKFKDDLGADSLDMVELVMNFEKDFDVTIPDEAVDLITTVEEAETYLKLKLGEVSEPVK